jgi:hypothetical protein
MLRSWRKLGGDGGGEGFCSEAERPVKRMWEKEWMASGGLFSLPDRLFLVG